MIAAGALWLAAPSGEAAKSGPWGFAIILLLAIAFYFLFKSMSRHLRRVREQYPDDVPAQGGEAAPSGLVKHPPAGTEDGRDNPSPGGSPAPGTDG